MLRSDEAAAALDELADRIRASPVALLCVERDPAGCHRTLVVEALATRVPHLTADDR